MTLPKEINKAPAVEPEEVKIQEMLNRQFKIILLNLENHKKIWIGKKNKIWKVTQ